MRKKSEMGVMICCLLGALTGVYLLMSQGFRKETLFMMIACIFSFLYYVSRGNKTKDVYDLAIKELRENQKYDKYLEEYEDAEIEEENTPQILQENDKNNLALEQMDKGRRNYDTIEEINM